MEKRGRAVGHGCWGVVMMMVDAVLLVLRLEDRGGR